jgi:hypothetical protein
MSRFDMYRDIHKGIRLAVFSYVNELGSADLSEKETLARLRVGLDELVELLENHAKHEDAHITPVLARIAPELTKSLVDDHHAYDATLTKARYGFLSLAIASPEERAERAHALYLELSSFTAAYLKHMQREEEEANRALWAAFDDAYLIALHDRLTASIPPAEMAQTLPWILRGANVDTRCMILSSVRDHAPKPMFEGVLGMARAVLSRADVLALEQRLDIDRELAPPSSRAA